MHTRPPLQCSVKDTPVVILLRCYIYTTNLAKTIRCRHARRLFRWSQSSLSQRHPGVASDPLQRDGVLNRRGLLPHIKAQREYVKCWRGACQSSWKRQWSGKGRRRKESGNTLRNEFKRRRVCVDFTWNSFIKSVNILIYSWGGNRKKKKSRTFNIYARKLALGVVFANLALEFKV